MVLFNKRCICTPLISEGKILFSFSFFLLKYQLGHCGHMMICSLFLPSFMVENIFLSLIVHISIFSQYLYVTLNLYHASNFHVLFSSIINIDSASSYILDSCTTFLLRLYGSLLLYENIMISLLNSYYPYIDMLLYFSLCVLFNTMLLVGKYLHN
jgi:hypothetical protein